MSRNIFIICPHFPRILTSAVSRAATECFLVVLQLWLQIFPQVLTGVLIFHIMMIGLLAIKESYATIIVRPSSLHTWPHIARFLSWNGSGQHARDTIPS